MRKPMSCKMIAVKAPGKARRELLVSLLCATAGVLAARAETETAEPDALLEYVEATGTQYVDTGINAETGLKARLDFEWRSSSSSSDWSLLAACEGTGAADTRTRMFLCHINNEKPFFGYGLKSRGNPANSFKFVSGKRYEVLTDVSDPSSLELYQNGKKTFGTREPTDTSRTEYSAFGSINLNLNLYLFACNQSGNPNWHCKARLYELKIFKKNGSGGFDLLRHYLPCIKNGRAGLYDKANGTISYSFTDTGLVAGPRLDEPLDFVKWLRSDGKQWFNTWVWGKGGLKSEVDVGVCEYDGDRCILGCRGDVGLAGETQTRLYMAYHYQSAFRYAYGALPAKSDINVVAPTNNPSYLLDTRYLIKADLRDGYQSMTVSRNGGAPVELHKDGQAYLVGENATTNTLFVLSNDRFANSGAVSATCPSKCILYGTKIWDGDELLRDFVPVVATNSGGVAYIGLYDTVARRIHRCVLGQSGSAEFSDIATQAGDVTNTLRSVSGPVTRLEYVESDGAYDYVDLGVPANAGIDMETTMEWLAVPAERAFVGARHIVAAGSDTPRVFPYSTYSVYTNNVVSETQHAYHYNNSRYTARDSGNNAVPIKANVIYKVASRLEQGAQRIAVWEREGGVWVKLGERSISSSDDINLGMPLYMFAVDEDNAAKYFVRARCRSLKLRVKRGDEYALVRDYVPVRDPVTGGAALWDKVSKSYFRNSGKYLLSGGGAERPFEQGLSMIVK